MVRRSIALEVGGFREEFDGAQDHDFIFRCTEKAEQILHVAKVLYSWRSHEASTATNPESKLYAYEAGKRAVSAHLGRTGRMRNRRKIRIITAFTGSAIRDAPCYLKEFFRKI